MLITEDHQYITFNSIKAALEIVEAGNIKFEQRKPKEDSNILDLSILLESNYSISRSSSPTRRSTRYKDLKPEVKVELEMHPVEFHVKGEKKDLHWTPVKSASDQPSSSIEYKSFNKDIEKVPPEVKEKKKKDKKNKKQKIKQIRNYKKLYQTDNFNREIFNNNFNFFFFMILRSIPYPLYFIRYLS